MKNIFAVNCCQNCINKNNIFILPFDMITIKYFDHILTNTAAFILSHSYAYTMRMRDRANNKRDVLNQDNHPPIKSFPKGL